MKYTIIHPLRFFPAGCMWCKQPQCNHCQQCSWDKDDCECDY